MEPPKCGGNPNQCLRDRERRRFHEIDDRNSILDAGIPDEETGEPTGERFSNAPRAKARAAWPVIQRFAPDKTEAQCRTIIHKWLDSGLLKSEDYDSPAERRDVKGLAVDPTKRPGTEIQT